jgi:site-specific recombinase XerC
MSSASWNGSAIHEKLRPVLTHGPLPWREELARIVGYFNRKHAIKDKDVSYKTREDRRDFYFAFFTELRVNDDACMRVRPRNLGSRHVAFMVRRWVARGLEPGTIQLYLSYLRTFAEWIGHPGLVLPAEKYVDDPAKVERSYAAATDKSWSAHGIVPDAKIAEVASFDCYVGCQLLMALRFNLRVKEAIMCPPHTAEVDGHLEVKRGTKGGRLRFVPIDTPEKRAALEAAKRCVESKSAHLGRPGKTLEQNLERFRYVMRKFGITKTMLGVTPHGLRHEYANDRYEEFAGVASPVRGGPAIERDDDRAARLRLAEELGHARENISAAYIGAVLRRPRAIAAKSAAETCASAVVSDETSDDREKE